MNHYAYPLVLENTSEFKWGAQGHPTSDGESEIQTQGCLTPEPILLPLGHPIKN